MRWRSIGPGAASATPALIQALNDKDAGVGRCAADALAAIGPPAARAVKRLTEALKDTDGYTRICAAGALGRMGKAAREAVAALRKARGLPFLEAEATWAIEQITEEKVISKKEADRIWELDLCGRFGVFPHETPNCSVAPAGDLLMVCTSNGVDEAHTNTPAPRAPSFVGVHKTTGEVAWQVVGPSPRVLHGQWSSPAVAVVKGRTIALFGGGDGWLYALEAQSGREIWRFNGNRPESVWRISGDVSGLTMRNNIIACPVVHDGVVFLAMGQVPSHGTGKGALFAIDPGGHGDVTADRAIWENSTFGRMIATPVIRNGLVFAADTNGFVHCLDSKNGREIWSQDLLASVWGGLILAGNHLYVGDEDGHIHVLVAGREKERVASMRMDASIWAVPAVANGVLYLSTARRLHAIGW